MRRTLALFVSSLLLWMLVTQLNDALAGYRVYLFAGSLFVTFAALTQPHGAGLAATILGGLVCDAHAPVAFGLHAMLFAAAHLALFRIRDRVPRGDNVSAIVVVLLTNRVNSRGASTLHVQLRRDVADAVQAAIPETTWRIGSLVTGDRAVTLR